jgi:hypothetical protein
MKKVPCTILSILAIALVLGTTSAVAQNVGDNTIYFTTYFSNNVAAAPDATLRLINDGDTGGDLWASIYVFDDSEELQECCSCRVTPDGLLSESVRNQLTANPITGIKPTRGVIKVISSLNESDANTSFAANTPTAGLRGWATHIQSVSNKNPNGPSPYSQTETALADSNLAAGEKSLLEALCFFDSRLSGKPCSCTPEDFDF